MSPSQFLEQIWVYCLALPEVSERLSHGDPAFFVQEKKCFVMVKHHHHGVGWLGLWCAAPRGFQTMMVQENPDLYFVPPYVGHRGWLGIRLTESLELAVLQEHLLEAYGCVAPQKLRDNLGMLHFSREA